MKDKAKIGFGCRIFLKSREPFAGIVDRARFCEKYGYDSVFIDDHLLYGTDQASAPDPFTTLAAVGVQTRRVRVGVAVTDFVRRHPAIVAQSAATLASMCPRRVFLGLGTGDAMNQTPFGLPSSRSFSVLKEGLKVMRMLWGSSAHEPARYNGRFFCLNNAYLQTGQTARPPPVYLGALGAKMLRLTGEQADGWIPSCHNPETYARDLKTIRNAARKAGKKPDQFKPAYYTLASVSKNRATADRRVLGLAKYFLALIPEGLRKVDPATSHPGRVWEKIAHPRRQREMIRMIAQTIPDEVALETVIHGTPDDCIEQISQFTESGCREMMLTLVGKDDLWSTSGLLSATRFFSQRVISYFDDR